jgi:hypothetical protein
VINDPETECHTLALRLRVSFTYCCDSEYVHSKHNKGNRGASVGREANKFVQCFSMYDSFTNFKTFIILETLLLKTLAERQVFIMNVNNVAFATDCLLYQMIKL